MNTFNTVILAAGAGTRMHSPLPKMLHKLAGKPMLEHILDQVNSLKPQQNYVVVGWKHEVLRQALAKYDNITFAYQAEQLGTAHAVNCGAQLIDGDEPVLVMFSDNPLVTAKSMQQLLDLSKTCDIALMTTVLDNPFGYGRIIRDAQGNVRCVTEQKDGTPEELAVKEVYPGIMVVKAKNLRTLLSQVDNNNAQNEYYLPKVVELAYKAGQSIKTLQVDPLEVSSANTKYQLAQLEDYYRQRVLKDLAERGLILASAQPSTFSLQGELEFGEDCRFDLNCVVKGKVVLGNRVQIGVGCVLKDCVIGDDSVIKDYSVVDGSTLADNVVVEPFSTIEKSQLAAKAVVGPYARLRPGAVLAEKAKVGNFVEIKGATLGAGTKVNHLAYVGDATVGANCNLGAGVITCNYDGANKYKTIIGDDVFVGSDCQLVAPVTIATGATVAAGTTVVKDIPAPMLVLDKKHRVEKPDWQRPVKKK